jgi:N-acetyltransferase
MASLNNVLAQTDLPEPGGLPAGFRLRQLAPGDRARITAVLDDWWGRAMAGLMPRPFFTEFRDTSFVIERENELVAFLLGFLSQANPDDAYIHAVAVAPQWRGHGFARLLYGRFVEVARRFGRARVRAVTTESNRASLAFHRRLGFAIKMPGDDAGEDARAQLVLELPRPTTADLDTATAYLAAAVLRVRITGTLVALEPLSQHHAGDLAAAAAGSDWSLMPVDGSTPAGFARWLERMLAGNGNAAPHDPRASFATVRVSDGRAIGSTSFHAIFPEHRRVEIAMTWYARSEWGSGANIEAKLLMLERAFAIGFRRVEFKTDARNLRSRRALEALPAQFEGVLRKHMLVRGGRRRDSAYYSVIDDDWPDVRANLERRLAKRRQRGQR